jgi:multisubunit Na+/H+ antiporter MnhB subunit
MSGMKAFGAVVAVAGLALAAFYVWFFNTYNDVSGGLFEGARILDTDKVQQRLTAVVFGVGVGIVGALVYGFNKRPSGGSA